MLATTLKGFTQLTLIIGSNIWKFSQVKNHITDSNCNICLESSQRSLLRVITFLSLCFCVSQPLCCLLSGISKTKKKRKLLKISSVTSQWFTLLCYCVCHTLPALCFPQNVENLGMSSKTAASQLQVISQLVWRFKSRLGAEKRQQHWISIVNAELLRVS